MFTSFHCCSVSLVAFLLLQGSLSASDSPKLEFLGAASIPGDARDLSGDAALLENGEPRNRLGGFSAMDYSGTGNRFAALSDRGPDDGAVGYPCRVQMFEIQLQPKAAVPVTSSVVETILLADDKGRQFTGSSAVIVPTSNSSHRLDPEGFRFASDGTMFVSDEYGPVLIQFSAAGKELRRFELPGHLLIQHPDADRKRENQGNSKGRASNRGMECLAISSDGKSLVGLMQSPLLQDGERMEDGTVRGRNCRLVQLDLESGHTSEFVYQMDSIDNGNSEIVAYAPNEYLVLERDSLAGTEAKYRRLIHISLQSATDVVGMESLPHGDLPSGIRPVARSAFLDFLDPQWGLAGQSMPEKIEGLTFGPPLADGRKTLLIGTDNDFESANASLIWVFALTP